MYNLLQNVITESGIWNGPQFESHKFLLSDSVLQITQEQKTILENLGPAINDCLFGLSHIAIVAYDKDANYNRDAWRLVQKVFATGIPKMYHEFQKQNVRELPKLLKVDLMLDIYGNFKIAEIDGHNKHGLGYSTLGMLFRQQTHKNSLAFSGVVCELAKEIKRQGRNELVIFYADQERFYLPEFKVAQKEFVKHGIACSIISETDAKETDFKGALLLDIPFLYNRVYLYEALMSGYRDKEITCIIPPKPFLGSKGVLALLRNDMQNEHLESILKTFIKTSSLELVRSHIPETYLIGKDASGILPDLKTTKRFVLKESISSGMKGIFFSDEHSFKDAMKTAKNAKLNWILQEEVRNQPQKFKWYTDTELLMESSGWFMRVTAHFVNRTIADVIVTARQDRAVHGAKDCLQLGTIIV